jgi:hypothetical protein
MAFCNSCGENLDSGARFCPKCGATQPVSATVPVAIPAAVSTVPPNSSATRTLLIIAAAVVVLGIAGACTAAFFTWRFARHTHVASGNGNVHVEGPFGTIQSSTDPEAAARAIGVDLYPGATVLKDKSSSVNLGSMHTVSAQLETSDPLDKVADFYKSRFPNANVSVRNSEGYTLVSTDNQNIVTINLKSEDGKTRISIANVSGKHKSDGSSD